MEGKKRQTGIDVIGAVPWGMHLCLFYEVKQDLLDILVPYFKTGLENNEFCIWVTSEPLNEKEAGEAMRKSMPGYAQYLKRGQIEIVPYTEWYLKDGVFNGQRVLNAWLYKLNQVLANGYDGIRVSGNTAWLEKEDWGKFADYEEEIDSAVGDSRMFAICTYSLDKCGVSEAMDVMRNHQGAVIKRVGKWILAEGSECIRLRHDLTERRKEIECIYAVTNITGMLDKPSDEVYQEVANLLPKSWQYPDIACAKITIDGKEFKTENCRETERKQSQSSDIKVHGIRRGVVEIAYFKEGPEIDEGPFSKEERSLIDAVAGHLGNVIGCKRVGKNREATVPATSRRQLTLLQERFVRSGFEGFSERENIELFLSLALSHRESQKLAKECLAEFKDFSGFLAAPSGELERIGVTPSGMFFIKLLHELPIEVLKQKVIEQPFYQSSQEVFDYLYYSMRDLQKEVFKAIYLKSRNQIIDTEDLFEGTLEGIPIHLREIVESVIKHSAAAVIFVHNHPSGNPTPSKSDIRFTRDLVFMGNIIEVKVLDHIIIGGNEYFSFADEGLIRKYEDSFLNLKIRGVFDSGAGHR